MYPVTERKRTVARPAPTTPIAIPNAEERKEVTFQDNQVSQREMLDGLMVARSTELSRLNEQLQQAGAQMNQLNTTINELKSKMLHVQGAIAGIKAVREIVKS